VLYLRLLRYLNSAMFGLRYEIKTISQALNLIGEDEIRRWCRLSGMLELSKNKPSDLALSALVRARFGELIGARVEHGDVDLFQVGLLSMMDAILDISMHDVLEDLPLDEAVRTVLLENKGPLSPIYELILAVEAGVWPKVEELATFDLKIDEDFIAQSHWEAMEWAHSVVLAA
jgi:EAL and modified HD-GYP domain-containing signal transduction protein